jgi:hypothetical protein
MPKSAGKKGGKKIGRAARKPAHQRYNLENRREKNKKRKMEKQKRLEEKKRLEKERRKENTQP